MMPRRAFLPWTFLSIGLLAGLSAAHAQELGAISESEIRSQGGVHLNGARLGKEITGNTLYWLFLAPMVSHGPQTKMKVAQGMVIPRYYPDSKVVVTKVQGKLYQGLWWIDGDNYCGEQRGINAGNQCYSVYDFHSMYYLCLQPAGNCNFATRLVPGNPEGF